MNWLLFGLLPTLYAHGLLHVLCAWIAAIGTFGLCRELGLGGLASTFAGLALAFSQDWLGLTGNSAIALASACVPLALWAVERWWRRPDVIRALTLALAITAVVLAGYPQALHAAALMAVWWRVACSRR